MKSLKQLKGYDIVLVDGMNLVHKYCWVFRNLKDRHGRHTGMFYGILNYCLDTRRKFGKYPTFLWDAGKSLRRVKLYPEYKAQRKPVHDTNFLTDIDILRNLLCQLGVTQYWSAGNEADDVAATLVKKNKRKRILLVSEDLDWWQMVSQTVHIYCRGAIYTPTTLKAAFGVNLDNFLLQKALSGDPSDNIKPLAAGIPRSSIQLFARTISSTKSLIQQCVSLRKRKSDQRAVVAAAILDNRKRLRDLLKLVKLYTDCKLTERSPVPDTLGLVKSLQEYDMRKLIERVCV